MDEKIDNIMDNKEQIFNDLINLLDKSTNELNRLNKQIESAVKSINDDNTALSTDACKLIFKSIPAILSSNSNTLNLLMAAVSLLEKNGKTNNKNN